MSLRAHARATIVGKVILVAGLLLILSRSAGASEFEAFARSDQVAASDLILVARVLSVHSEWAADRSAIHTDAELLIDAVWKGSPDGDRVIVRNPGGTVDGIASRIDGAAEFTVGERVLVFLKRRGAAFEPLGMRFGKYEIIGSGADASLVGNLPPAVTAAQKFEQVSLRLDEVRGEIAALVAKERR